MTSWRPLVAVLPFISAFPEFCLFKHHLSSYLSSVLFTEVSTVYSFRSTLVLRKFLVLALVQIYKHYSSFISSCKDSASGNLSLAHYVRLMIMALTQIFWVTTVSTTCLIFNYLRHAVRPYDSWADVHLHFYVIWTIPVMILKPGAYQFQYITWYIVPVSTLIFVSLFSFGEEAMQEYRRCFKWVYSHAGLRWVDKRLSNVLPERFRERRASVLPPLE